MGEQSPGHCFTTPPPRHPPATPSPDHILRAMTDIVVLSTSDVLLTSSLSTFGYVAAVLLPRDKVWVQVSMQYTLQRWFQRWY